jgi:hypothetical protein
VQAVYKLLFSDFSIDLQVLIPKLPSRSNDCFHALNSYIAGLVVTGAKVLPDHICTGKNGVSTFAAKEHSLSLGLSNASVSTNAKSRSVIMNEG